MTLPPFAVILGIAKDLGSQIMIPINVAESPTARRLMLVFSCPDPECGHESLEPLSRFHARYKMGCGECGAPIDLKAKENRIILEKLVEFCARTDASLKEFD